MKVDSFRLANGIDALLFFLILASCGSANESNNQIENILLFMTDDDQSQIFRIAMWVFLVLLILAVVLSGAIFFMDFSEFFNL